MPFIPHTDEEIKEMLAEINAASIEDLFDEIPQSLRQVSLEKIPSQASEMEVSRLMAERAAMDGQPLCFIGAGAYEHHIPAAVWELATRGEFYTAYTPYQAEASQGTLQLLYEFQTMMANLTAMDVSNASLYDGGSGLAEAVLMAVRANRKSKSKRVLMPRTVHPNYQKAVHATVHNQGIVLDALEFDAEAGTINLGELPEPAGDFAALIIQQPNFFGNLEDMDALTNWAHQQGALVIAVVNPVALALLTPPGEWGELGADIACGDGQPLGIPLSSGGPYYGFLCCKQALVRQMPGRIIGRTVDLDGKPGFTLTLQAREQHIRRSKATSNICTNQGLMVTASTIFMALLGARGLKRVASSCYQNTHKLAERLSSLRGAEIVFHGPRFHELVVRFDAPATALIRALQAQNVLLGYPLATDFPELENAVLICATETKTDEDLDTLVQHVQRVLSKHQPVKCPITPK